MEEWRDTASDSELRGQTHGLSHLEVCYIYISSVYIYTETLQIVI